MKCLVSLLLVFLVARVGYSQTTQVVVLRNGNVLEGQIDRLADGYYVTTKTSEFRLASRDVERIAATLHDAYAAKRDDVRDDSVSDRIQLASWCMRQALWQAAATELAAAREINPRDPRLGYLHQRLQVLSRPAKKPSPVEPKQQNTGATQRHAAEIARLEALAAELPEGTLEDFARHIQPILVNGCAVGGCHSTGDQREFRLNRDLVRGLGNRESTLRNLDAVMRFVDKKTPTYSPLLLQPAVPHGGLPHPVFAGPRQKVQERLEQWVRQATGTEQPEPASQPTTNIELVDHQVQARPPATAQTPPAQPKEPRHFWEDPAAMADGQLDEAVELDSVDYPEPEPSIQYGAQLKKFEPRDEFDPELFNRMHRDSAQRDNKEQGSEE